MLQLYPQMYLNMDMVTDSVMSVNNSHWVEARDKAVLQVYDEVSRVCVVKGVHSHESIATAMVHEPFRANMDPQMHILYKWICLCDVCLSTGFCGHFFSRSIIMIQCIHHIHQFQTQHIVGPCPVWIIRKEAPIDVDVQGITQCQTH